MLKKGITIVLTLLLVLPILFPTVPVYSNNEQVVIKVDNLNVREGPGLTYNIVSEVHRGESYKVIERKNDWIQISLDHNKAGWVAGWFVEENEPEISTSSQAVVTVDGLRIRKGPGLHFGIIGFINQDQYVNVNGSVEGWVNITTHHVNGWVSEDYLKILPNSEAATQAPTTVGKKGTITTNRLNVRNEPSLNSSVIGKLNEGEEVSIQAVESDWVKIQFNGTKAWVSSQYVSIKENVKEESSTDKGEQTNPPSNPTDQAAIVTASTLNVREDGSLTSKITDYVSKGEKVIILDEKNKWNKIRYNNDKIGWVAGWFLEKAQPESKQPNEPSTPKEQEEIIILYNGTNIRVGPATTYPVVQRANQGQTFKIVNKVGDWYEIELAPENPAYVAGWIVSTANDHNPVEKANESQYLSGKTIVIDAGHGGEDDGTTGSNGIIEKKLTIRTSQLLAEKLKAAGARVIMTRGDDRYLSLRSRVSLSHYYNADVFLSIHYDSFQDSSVNGITAYYHDSSNRSLAQFLQSEMVSRTKLNDRGARYGNYFVIRENKQPAVLLELGFLSNPVEEVTVQTTQFQEEVTSAIYYGLAKYFKTYKR